MQPTSAASTGHSAKNRLASAHPHRARRAGVVLASISMVALVASSCGSSTKVDTSSGSKSTQPGSTVAQAAAHTGPFAKAAGTWTAITGHSEIFCAVGQAIGPDDEPVSSPAEACDLGVNWAVVNQVKVGADGQLSMSFSYQGGGTPSANEPADATREGTCTASAKVSGGQLGLDDLGCTLSGSDANKIDSTGLGGATWVLDGSCLTIGDATFEQKVGECKDAGVEEKFSSVGNAIGDAS